MEGVFFDGQVWDAYELLSQLIRSARERIILIDNYIDDSVLTLLDKRAPGVSAMIYTMQISRQLSLDIAKKWTAIMKMESIDLPSLLSHL